MANISRAQISRTAIERIYIAMRHLFIRGGYKPLGISGASMKKALLDLQPEIYGSISDPEKVELNGLLYIFQRLPKGIEECRYIKLISREGYEDSSFEAIVPSKRRRNCYRIDKAQMFIEMTRGRSDIYDILTHLTFMYIEAEKIRQNGLDSRNQPNRSWKIVESIVTSTNTELEKGTDLGLSHLSILLGRTYAETQSLYTLFKESEGVNNLFSIVYYLGKLSMDEFFNKEDREITFSSSLREQIGRHDFGEPWATKIKMYIYQAGWKNRPIHIISSNMHSVKNSLYGLGSKAKGKHKTLMSLVEELSKSSNSALNKKVNDFAMNNGLTLIEDTHGTNIPVQLIDCEKLDVTFLPKEIKPTNSSSAQPIILVMDYAFGEQAYETMDELLKPLNLEDSKHYFNIESINIMGKAGILSGSKGDVMIPDAHVFEGTADNYYFENDFDTTLLEDAKLNIKYGPMITVLGTSLQNRDVLRYFLKSSWKAAGLEMEGAHYQKAIQAASKIRKSIRPNVVLRYAYYASDNPLESGSTLASGGLGLEGVKPTYLITLSILNGILSS
jgi:hypothetical protein